MLLYDQYDVWLADPATGNATNLTRGAGRRTHTVYSPLQTDPEATSFAADKPILLSLIETKAFETGFARVTPSGGVPSTLLKLPEMIGGPRNPFAGLHDQVMTPLAAKRADRLLFHA